MIMAQSLFMTLRARQPEVQIDVLAPAWSAGILGRMPQVRRALPSPFAHGQFDLAGRRRLARALRAEDYAQAIVLPNSWKSALVPWLARIPLRTGYVGEFRYGLLNDARTLDQTALPLLADRYCALASPPHSPRKAGHPRLRIDPQAQQAALARQGLNTDRPILALCPGAEFGPAKRWPEAHYAAVARAKLAQGWQVWLFGSAKDRPVTDAIAALLPAPVANLAGLTSLEEVVDLLALARAVVSNDSGLMHLAAAVDAPLAAIYGSSDPGYTPPLSPRARVLRLGLECSPCFQRECPLGHLDCLHKLTPEQVLEALPQ
ncbi:MAG: lipopolysaccharide heptosyltransferase II [Betaproteobacteria bacterium]|nr:lipopolysaccharide heptosyltransferase II [Betaproteobacteria bacterium]